MARILSALAIGLNWRGSIALRRDWMVLVVVMSETRVQNLSMVPKRAGLQGHGSSEKTPQPTLAIEQRIMALKRVDR